MDGPIRQRFNPRPILTPLFKFLHPDQGKGSPGIVLLGINQLLSMSSAGVSYGMKFILVSIAGDLQVFVIYSNILTLF